MSSWGGLGLQEGMCILIEMMTHFHDYIIVILLLVLGFVSYIFILVSCTSLLDKYVVESHSLELIWTLLPIRALLFIAFPSLYLLYLTEDVVAANTTVKIVGHQWYWEYQYENSLLLKEFDSYLSNRQDSLMRNLDVDNRLSLPLHLPNLLLVGSADVLHSWTLPSMGVKVDAIPGRLNCLVLTPLQVGVVYGQCSELCGANHRFMPIMIEGLYPADFVKFILA